MPYVKIWIHIVWTTKNRERIITKELRPKLLKHILKNAKEKSIFIKEINCVDEHVHALVSLDSDQTVGKILQLIKGESSHWINNEKLTSTKFSWQDEYFAISVSELQIDKVINYIKKQEEHHRVKSFSEEYNEFIKKFGFENHRL